MLGSTRSCEDAELRKESEEDWQQDFNLNAADDCVQTFAILWVKSACLNI